MFKRFLMVLLTLITAIVAVLLAAKNPTGPNTVSYDEPLGLWLSIGMIVVLFLPPLFLSLFNNMVVKIISAVYQGFIVIAFLGLIPIGFFVQDGVSVGMVGIIGTIISICSIVVTIVAGWKR
ncbi:hypothetical protein [Gracilibacillus alcaliphilus]|uniref:hypothetical protein n=1 Tax=Gracilibacillus alcaliphilus TaxID=1401441 RepID=UPI00195B0EC4|nr:hypothetical protein [Gracilibacillus alcaliphilus]MBM7677297.1 hypothetical protein [Gracilibacillus alcaliphilus]